MKGELRQVLRPGKQRGTVRCAVKFMFTSEKRKNQTIMDVKDEKDVEVSDMEPEVDQEMLQMLHERLEKCAESQRRRKARMTEIEEW